MLCTSSHEGLCRRLCWHGAWPWISDGKEMVENAKIDGYTAVLNEQAHHPPSAEIVTVLSHYVFS